MNAKTYLNKTYKTQLKINVKIEYLKGLRDMLYNITSHLEEDKVMRTKTKSPMEDTIINILTVEDDVFKEIEALISMKEKIRRTIEAIRNEENKLLLELRYICFNNWDEIARKLNYSGSYVYKRHNMAMNDFEETFSKLEGGVKIDDK